MSEINRRQFLNYMAALPCSMLFTDNSHAEAANPKLNHLPEHSPKSSSRHLRGVIHELEGDVFINKNIANLSSIIQSGDRVSVAYGARLIFSMADDTYLLQEASSLELVSHNDIAISGLRLLTGGLLSVFGPRETPTNIYTRTAVIGIRGTGVYLNSQPEKLYFCTCYGKTDLHLGRHHTEHIEATHHHAFDITGNTQNTMTMQATQVIGHSDDELRRLEHYSGRKPSFDL